MGDLSTHKVDRVVDRAWRLLHPALHPLESRAQRAGAGGSRRHGAFPVLFLLHRAMAAGGVLFHRPPDPGGAASLSVQRAVRTGVVRLCLPADGMDGPLSVCGAPHRGRPARPDQARRGAVDRGQDQEAGRQARRMAPDRALHRRRSGSLFRGRAGAAQAIADLPGAVRRRSVDGHSDVHDLFARRPHARTGVPLHVPVAAHPGRPHRHRRAQRHLPLRPGRAAHVGQGSGQGPSPRRGGWRLHRLHAVRRRLPDRGRHPQRLAARLHPVWPVHRRLRCGDGQSAPADASHRL